MHLTKCVYKHLLCQSVTYDDLQAYDPDYYRNLNTMLEYSLEDLGMAAMAGAMLVQLSM